MNVKKDIENLEKKIEHNAGKIKDNTALVRIDGKDYWLSSVPLKEV